jgi:hypothetical protein
MTFLLSWGTLATETLCIIVLPLETGGGTAMRGAYLQWSVDSPSGIPSAALDTCTSCQWSSDTTTVVRKLGYLHAVYLWHRVVSGVQGAGFIEFARNDIAWTNWAGIYLAQESSYQTYGSFDLHVVGNTIRYANLIGSHDGMLAYSSKPALSNRSLTFGEVPSRVERVTIENNTVALTAKGIGNGFGIEIRASVDQGQVLGNAFHGNRSPQLVCAGTHFTCQNEQSAQLATMSNSFDY